MGLSTITHLKPLGYYSNQTFKTSVLIETKKIQEISKGNIIYIDTPGLSVDINDNKKSPMSFDMGRKNKRGCFYIC